jgi:hypothetical protein
MWPLRENTETHCTLLAYNSIRNQYTPFVIRNNSEATVKRNYTKRITWFVNYLQIVFQ